MPSPRNLKELRSLPGRLQPLISKVQTRCQSFSRQDAFGGQNTKKKAAPKKGKSEMVVFLEPAKRRSMSVPASPFDEAILDPEGCAVLGCTFLPHAGDEMKSAPIQWFPCHHNGMASKE